MSTAGNGSLTFRWLASIIGAVLLGILGWLSRGMFQDLQAQKSVNVTQEWRIERHDIRLGRQDTLLAEIRTELKELNATLNLMAPRR